MILEDSAVWGWISPPEGEGDTVSLGALVGVPPPASSEWWIVGSGGRGNIRNIIIIIGGNNSNIIVRPTGVGGNLR